MNMKIKDIFWKRWMARKHNTISWFERAKKRRGWANEVFYELAFYYYKIGFKDGKKLSKTEDE